jgi:plasmid stabilization system protein ParE
LSGRSAPAPTFATCARTSHRIPPYYATRFVEKILKSVETLNSHPHLGRKVPEADREDIRELLFQNYRIIYHIRAEQIYVVTVIHGSRDLAGQEQKPWEVV